MAALRLVRLELLADHLLRREGAFRDRTNLLDTFCEEQLQLRLRFGRDGIACLAYLLLSEIEHPTRRSGALSAQLQVMLALKFFATGCFPDHRRRYDRRPRIDSKPHGAESPSPSSAAAEWIRRMFPVLRVMVSGMESSTYYMLLVDLVPADNFRYRFLGNCWLPTEAAESDSGAEPQLYLHDHGPCLGSQWALRPVDFGAIKLSNQGNYGQHQMKLQSMRKYVPRVHVFAGSDVRQLEYRRFKTFIFPETSFISVTSYQNEQIIALKIQNNPYARSFCTNAERRSALKRLLDEESASDEETNGNSSKFRPLITLDGPETSLSSPPSDVPTMAVNQQRLVNQCPAFVTTPSIPPYPYRYTSQPCFPYPAYATCLDWCSSVYGLGRQHYGCAAATAAESCRSYVPSPYLSAAATSPLLSPTYFPAFTAGYSVGAMSVTPSLSVTSSSSVPSAASAAAASLLSSATYSESPSVSSSTASSLPIMSLLSTACTPASQPSRSNATL